MEGESMEDVFDGLGMIMTISAVACLVVLIAMGVDLASGIYKAGLRGERKNSLLLRYTLMKFIQYQGGMIIAVGIDLLIMLARLKQLLHLDILKGVPIVALLVGVFLLIVEFLSVREKADQKLKKGFAKVEDLAIKVVQKQEFIDALASAITKKRKEGEDVSSD